MASELELHDSREAFEQLEEYTASATGPVDAYLGYGLSAPLRREATPPAPPEPCALPLLAAGPRARPRPAHGFRVGAWDETWDAAGHRAAIGLARAAIARGELYQVNLVQHLSAPFDGDAWGLAAALAHLRPLHPRPLEGAGWAIVSASPELFLQRRGARIVTRPIKGTRPLGEHVDGPKDAAEHVMIVDLERNDLARVCEPGSVRWPELMRERELAGVTHLESVVEGRLRPGVGLAEILRATFPGGSITGAPKVAALDHVARLEPVGRGASMGAIGTIRRNGDFDLALTIRTFAIADGRVHVWAGGGIVWDSDPAEEVEESLTKLRPLLEAVREPVAV